MLESGTISGWVVPRVQDAPRLNKPPLSYWLQASSAWLFGDAPGQWKDLDGGQENIWVFRIPSVIAAILTILLTWRIGLMLFDPRVALLGAALLAVCPVMVWDAHQARADQIMVACCTGALWALVRMERGHHRTGIGPCVVLWVSIAMGGLAKGPIPLLILVLAVSAICIVRRQADLARRSRPVLGVLIIIAVTTPWILMVVREVGWDTWASTVWNETLGRSATSQEGHWGPPGYHTVLLAVLFWPGSLTTAAAFKTAWRRSTKRSRPGRVPETLLVWWVLPAWVVFEIIATKLPHYTMPLYPAIALLSARQVLREAARPAAKVSENWSSISALAAGWGRWLWWVIGAGLVAAWLGWLVLAVGRNAVLRGGPWITPPAIASFAGVCLAAWLIWHMRHHAADVLRAQVRSIMVGALVLGAALQFGLPGIMNLSVNVVSEAAMTDPKRQLKWLATGYVEDSLVFLSRGHIRRVSVDEAMVVAGSGEGERTLFLAPGAAGSVGDAFQPSHDAVSSMNGFNYSKGRFEQVSIFVPRMRGERRSPEPSK